MKKALCCIMSLLCALVLLPSAVYAESSWELLDGDPICRTASGAYDPDAASMEISMPALGTWDTYGDACLIRSDGEALLVDTCMPGGADILISFLKEKGAEDLSIFISHYHNDHIGAVPAILQEEDIHVDTIYLPDPGYMYGEGKEDEYEFNKSYENMDAIVKYARERGTKLRYVGQGDTFETGLVKAEIIYQKEYAPYKGLKPSSYVNNLSLCTMFTCGNVRFLSCGDIQERTEDMMLEDGVDVSADIFKMNHHGGRTSNTERFLNAVGADVMYFNCPVEEDEMDDICDHPWTSERVSCAQAIGNVFHSVINKGLTISVKAGRITVEGENTRQVKCTAYDGRLPVETEFTVQGACRGEPVITEDLLPWPCTPGKEK